jgi:integrase/recombinase XerC
LETEGTEDLKKVDKKIIRNFIVSLSEKKIQKRSINRKLSSLRSFYLYLLKIGEIQVSPLETIPSLKFYAEKQIPISEEEMENLGEILESESEQFFRKAYYRNALPNWNEKVGTLQYIIRASRFFKI